MFETRAREAAILIMPGGAVTHNVLNHQPIREYFAENVDSWYKFAIETRGRIIKNGEIRVVIGCDKVSSWGIATLSSDIEQNVRFEFKDTSDGSASRSYSWDRIGSCGGSCRVGPDLAELEDLLLETDTRPLQNQCVFVRTMNLSFAGEMDSDAAAVHSQMESSKATERSDSQSQHTGSSNIQSNSSTGCSQSKSMHISFNTMLLGVSVSRGFVFNFMPIWLTRPRMRIHRPY